MLLLASTLRAVLSMCLLQDFAQLDTDGSGMLGRHEIRLLIARQLGTTPTEVEFQAFMSEVDIDKNGAISLNEYIAAVVSDKNFTVEVRASLSMLSLCMVVLFASMLSLCMVVLFGRC